MILLRIRIDGETQEHRFERDRVTLGSGPGANLSHAKAGWPVRAATLERRGAGVVLVVPGRVGTVPLAPGQPITLGRAELTLLAAPPPPPPEFGDYDLSAGPAPQASAAAFELEQAPTAAGGARREGPGGVAPAAPSAATTPATSTDPFSRRLDFDTELFAQLKRAPWFLASVALHLLVFLLFWLVHPVTDRHLAGRGGNLSAAMVTNEEREAREPEEPSALPEAETSPVPPEMPERDPLLEQEPAPIVDQVIELGPFEPEGEPSSDLGTAPSLSAAGRRTAKKPSRPPPAPSIDLERTIAEDNVHDARRSAAAHVREQLGVGHGGPGEALTALKPDDLVVVQGEYDHQERVLRDLGIPYRSLAVSDPRMQSGEALRKARFLFWNCGFAPSERLLRQLAPEVRAFVARGGYLFTSDWVVGHVLARAFPELIGTHGTAAALRRAVVAIRPTAAGRSHPLLEGVFHADVTGLWWLEDRSHDIVLPRPKDVTVLIESPDLGGPGGRPAPMAVTFAHGTGRVLHILGHYDQEEGNLAGAVAAQRIALNFVLMSLSEAPLRAAR